MMRIPVFGETFFGDINGRYNMNEWLDGDVKYRITGISLEKGIIEVHLIGRNRSKAEGTTWIDRDKITWLEKHRVWVFHWDEHQ